MALRAKVRGQWRVISKAMARRFRARGLDVRDGTPVYMAPEQPPAPIVEQVTVVYPGTTSADVAREVALREAAAREAAQLDPIEVDLTDDELERLTAPGGGA